MRHVAFVALTSVLAIVSVPGAQHVAANAAHQQQSPACKTSSHCRQMTLDALAAGEYERAHDLAWRLFQVAGARDTGAMALLARTQSLSGRGDDAFVMVQRIAEAGVVVDDVETSDDFRRVRDHVRWPELLETITRLRHLNAPAAETAPLKPADTIPAAETRTPPSEPPVADATAGGTAGAAAPPPPAPPPPSSAAELAMPATVPLPRAMAYDAVSARFIIADATTDILRVVSETSGNATNLVSPGWSGHTNVTAVAIDRRSGDMWVTAADKTRAVLHRLQLISGRLLQSIASDERAEAAAFTAIALAADGVYVLDAAADQVLLLTPKSTLLRVAAKLPKDLEPLSLAHAGAGLYVSHVGGLLWVNLTSGTHQGIATSGGVDVSRLHSLAWRDGALFAIQADDDGPRVVRIRLNARGTSVRAVDVLETAAGTSGTLAGDAYYFVATRMGENGLAFRSVRIGK